MAKVKKVGICAAAAAGVGLAVFAFEKFRKKWYIKGYNTGEVIGGMSAAEQLTDQFADEYSVIVKKYNKLCKDYDELERAYDELCNEYD